MFDYESPIKMIMQEVQAQREGRVYEAIQNIGVDVDKEELLRALSYDRGQYEKGYRAAVSEIVHCKDCKHYATNTELLGNVCNRIFTVFPMKPDDFCSYGERKDEE